MKKAIALAEVFLLITALQAERELILFMFRPIFYSGTFEYRMLTMAVMIFLSGVTVFYSRVRGISLSVFPQKFGKTYIIFTCIAAVLLITTPSNFNSGWQAIMLLIYGSIVTPVYEELIFRGYIWNRLSQVMSGQISVYIWSVVLFTLWHAGYMVSQMMAGNFAAFFGKLAAGAGYGIVLGIVRMKTKNCYSTMLVHGIINIFMV